MGKLEKWHQAVKPGVLAAICVFAVLLVLSLHLLRAMLDTERLHAAADVAARQRALAQSAALLSDRLQQVDVDRGEVRNELVDLIALLDRSHRGLLHGDRGLGLRGHPPAAVQAIYFETPHVLDTQIRNMIASAKMIALANDAELMMEHPAARYLHAAGTSRSLHGALDALEDAYRVDYADRLAGLRRLASMLTTSLIVLLILLVAWLLFPLARRLGRHHSSDLRALNEIMEQRAQELARSNADLEQFAYVASHDLQEPLRMVASYVQLLEKRYKDKLDADAGEFIGYAVGGVTRMQALINGLLAYSRVGTRGKELSPVNCETVYDLATANLQAAIEAGHADVTHEPLPTVMGDATQLMQLLQNLIGNALKFRREDRVMVHVSAAQREHEWIFSVRDNGIGIAPQHRDRIFGIFQRLHTEEEFPGTGIGLAVCKKIVERHGGRIWVESELGKGATFFFTIPAMTASSV